MKLLAICGSPRKGNTEFMLNTVLDVLKEKGFDTELILLREKKIEHCNGCLTCEDTGKCVINDDAIDINKKFKESDILILGSPCYFDMMTSLMKTWIDRTNPIYFDKPKGKSVYILAVGAAGKDSVKMGAESLKRFCEIHEMKVKEVFLADGQKCNDISKQKETIEKLKKFGDNIGQGLL